MRRREYMPAGQLTVGIHMGTWSKPRKPLAAGETRIAEDIEYSAYFGPGIIIPSLMCLIPGKEDDEAIEYVSVQMYILCEFADVW
jgi:hypothetical protein